MEVLSWVLVGVLGLGLIITIVLLCHYMKVARAFHEQWKLWMTSQGEEENKYRALMAQNRELTQLRDNLKTQVDLTRQELDEVQYTKVVAETQVSSANTQFNDTMGKLEELKKQVEERKKGVKTEVEEYRKKLIAEGQANLEQELGKSRQAATEALLKELEALRTELAGSHQKAEELGQLKAELEQKCEDLKKQVDGMALTHAEAVKRMALEVGTGGHVRLEPVDRDEATLIRKMCRGMRCENAVLKASYDVYVKPEMERLVREAGVAGVSGIYRIWKVEGEKELSYVGQAVDVGERWKTHAKRAWGVDNTGRIKLYQAMISSGIEEWNWELLEACENEKLSEKERYWGEFYAVKEIGLNSKLG